MLNFSKLKIFSIVAVCLFSLFFALPSLVGDVGNSSLKKFLPDNKVNLGLDLQGGSQLTLKVDFDYYINEQLNNLQNELKVSFRENGVRALPVLQNAKITFSLFEKFNKKELKEIVKNISNEVELEEEGDTFVISYPDDELVKIQQKLIAQSIEIIRRRVDENGTKEPIIQAQGKSRILLQVPGLQNSAQLKEILGQTAKMSFQFVKTPSSFSDSIVDYDVIFDDSGNRFLVEREVILSGDLLIDANTTYYEGEPAVSFRFNDLGSKKFAQITKDNVGRIFAIVLDNKVITAPRINTAIVQGSGVISGNFTVAEANNVALLLRAGALPAPLEIIEERTVGPSLGLDSIKSGSLSALAGLLFVAVFMIYFYRTFGFFANVSLVVNILIIITVLSFIGATLTLPGIAGIVLTMGMAVDANVLIFERIKEEFRLKQTIFSAVDKGFSESFRTITDSNITALIVSFFLYIFGSGPVKGFAVTLSIGILASMFSAIMLTRLMISSWLKKNKSRKINLV